MERKQLGEILTVALPVVGLLAISFLGFSDNIKKQAIEKQGGICPVCGNKLCSCYEAHHRVPKSKTGNNSLANCVVVDGDTRGRDCHERIDRNALDRGLIFLSPEEPAVPIENVPVELFKSERAREQVIHKFSLNDRLNGCINFVRKHTKRHKHSNHHGNRGHR